MLTGFREKISHHYGVFVRVKQKRSTGFLLQRALEWSFATSDFSRYQYRLRFRWSTSDVEAGSGICPMW